MHPGFVAACDGFRPLVASALDGALHAELAEPVLLTLLHLADHPRTRRQFRPFLELQAVLAPFTALDAAAPAPERAALLEVRPGVLIFISSNRESTWIVDVSARSNLSPTDSPTTPHIHPKRRAAARSSSSCAAGRVSRCWRRPASGRGCARCCRGCWATGPWTRRCAWRCLKCWRRCCGRWCVRACVSLCLCVCVCRCVYI